VVASLGTAVTSSPVKPEFDLIDSPG